MLQIARSGRHHSPIGATSHHSAGGPPQMPERELRPLALERAAWFAAGRRWLSSGFMIRITVHSPSREAAYQLASGSDACVRSVSAIASSRVITLPPSPVRPGGLCAPILTRYAADNITRAGARS